MRHQLLALTVMLALAPFSGAIAAVPTDSEYLQAKAKEAATFQAFARVVPPRLQTGVANEQARFVASLETKFARKPDPERRRLLLLELQKHTTQLENRQRRLQTGSTR